MKSFFERIWEKIRNGWLYLGEHRQAAVWGGIILILLIVAVIWRFNSGGLAGNQAGKQSPQNKLRQQFADQLPDLQKQVEKDPNNPDLQQQLGVAKYATNDLQGAKEAYEKGVSLNSDNAIMHNNLGNVYRDLSDYSKAEAEYRRAMELNPKLTTPYSNLASIYQYNLGKPETALAIYESGIKSVPEYIDFYNSIALLYEQQGLKDKAIDAFKRALKVQPSNQAAQSGLERLEEASR
ncbi:MAG TPA: tetratricopeptide repeat protein [bacterium]|nr:tetratricopeptide repeat protein [bacterium]